MVRNIFIEKNVVCPACKNTFELRYPNPKLYAAAGRDTDSRITAYTWAQGLKTDAIPHYYAVAQCPQCMFADVKENFENSRYSSKDRLVHETRNKLELQRVLILRKLRRLVPQDPGEILNLQSALALHLAAIFLARLPENEEDIDHLKLGRLYLRLSWLYREQKGGSSSSAPGKGETDSPTLDKLSESLKELQGDFLSFSDRLGGIRVLVGERSRELGIVEEPGQNPYYTAIGAIGDKINEVQPFLDMLQQAVITDKNGNLNAAALSSDSASGESQKILAEVVQKWPDMPQSEEICLRQAIKAFDYSFKYEDTEQSTEQSLSLVNLVVKLLLKIGDLDGALDYITQIFKSGFRDKQELQRRLSQGKQQKSISEAEQRNIMRKIATVNNTLAQAGETRRKVLELIYEKHKDKMLPILKQSVEKSAEEQKKAILDAGLPEDLIPFLRDRGLIKKEETKKGWFSKKQQ